MSASNVNRPAALPLRAAIWVVQVLLAALFVMGAVMKLATPIPELAKMMPWTGDHSELFVRFTGIVDLAGGLGLILPALTRILPWLTPLAALGCSVLQVFAIVFHLSRGEPQMMVVNIPLLALSLFVLWGRSRKAPIAPR
jgi:uncharacterized membrane protein YphA (DoxX/SURF4 family)